jgi:2-amino-4-hydroxy-6-hydroxymethyldihydropteridine diphosphokinase
VVQSGPAGCRSVAVALGANLGDPPATLLAVRPLLAELLLGWWMGPGIPRLRWSPLFRTAPVGGPADQPAYLNAVVVVDGGPAQTPADRPELQGARPQPDYLNAVLLLQPLPPGPADPLALLRQLQGLEARFARQRLEHWGPRSLDLDLLWCGAAAVDQPGLSLPHPRLRERAFVLTPLAAIDPALLVPGAGAAEPASVRALLEGLPPPALEPPPQRLGGVPGWPE